MGNGIPPPGTIVSWQEEELNVRMYGLVCSPELVGLWLDEEGRTICDQITQEVDETHLICMVLGAQGHEIFPIIGREGEVEVTYQAVPVRYSIRVRDEYMESSTFHPSLQNLFSLIRWYVSNKVPVRTPFLDAEVEVFWHLLQTAVSLKKNENE